jgi:hypothetical protein
MTAPHETDRFRNAATYTVAVTFTVAGGSRSRTAHRRAGKAAERITAAAARLADVVDARAVVGLAGQEGELLAPQVVRFASANTGHGTYGEPDKLSRYLDPEHERALASLEEANAQHRRHRQADRDRRLAVGCRNAGRQPWDPAASCECVYCEPDRHLDTLTGLASGLQFWSPRCVCGQVVPSPGARCSRHRDTEIVVLDDDAEVLRRISDHLREAQP